MAGLPAGEPGLTGRGARRCEDIPSLFARNSGQVSQGRGRGIANGNPTVEVGQGNTPNGAFVKKPDSTCERIIPRKLAFDMVSGIEPGFKLPAQWIRKFIPVISFSRASQIIVRACECSFGR